MSENTQQKFKALLIDDSISAAKIAQRIYGDICEVDVVSDFPEAVERIAQATYELFIVDYLLPSSSGIEIVRLIRSMEMYDTVPVILISAAMTNQLAFGAMRAGANVSFSKVTSAQAIREEICRQMTNPSTHVVDLEVIETGCLIWRNQNIHYQYSPELQLTLSGVSEDLVHSKMEQALLEYYNTHGKLELFSDDITIKRHLIMPR